MNVLKIKDLCKSYQNSVILKDINLEVKQNETVAIIGQTGCGKTTLARCICGFTNPTSGKINFLFENKPGKIQYIFQNHSEALNPFFTIEQSIKEVLRITRKIKDPEHTFLQLMHNVDLDDTLFKKYPGELSSGQKQRAVIARALAADPLIVVADEPTSNLDRENESNVLTLFEQLKKTYGLTLILISHNLDSVKKYADRIVVMLHGEIIEIINCMQTTKATQDYTKRLINQENSYSNKNLNSIGM